MGDNEALTMLMDHLARVKLEASERQFELQRQVKELQRQVADLEDRAAEYEDELEAAHLQVDDMREQQTKKWRVEALDDWKTMVAQLNEDRSRLQKEVDALRAENGRLLGDLGTVRENATDHDNASEQPLPPPQDSGADSLREEVEELRRQVQKLLVEKRSAELELKRLRQEVKEALRSYSEKGAAGVGLALIQSLGSVLWSLRGGRRGKLTTPCPVLQV